MTAPLPQDGRPVDPGWRAERLAEARAIIADVAHHRDSLIRLACKMLITHGETPQEREDARLLLVVIDARTPLCHGHHHRPDRDAPEVQR